MAGDVFLKGDTYHVEAAVFGSHSHRKPNRRPRTGDDSPLQIATIPVGQNGARIGLTLSPGKNGPSVYGAPWERQPGTDVTVIRDWGASAVLTLLEPYEFGMIGVEALAYAVCDAGMVWHYASIPDEGASHKPLNVRCAIVGLCLMPNLDKGRFAEAYHMGLIADGPA